MKRIFSAALLAVGLMPALPATQANAQDALIGTVSFFAGNFAPRGYAFCDGQLLSIASNTALFSILGTTYGGDGRTTFGLPDVRGRTLIHAGTGAGLTPRRLGEKSGVNTVPLTFAEMPSHSHTAVLKGSTGEADGTSPEGALFGESAVDMYLERAGSLDESLANSSLVVLNNGGSQPHNNMMPFASARCIIALFGIYPSRN